MDETRVDEKLLPEELTDLYNEMKSAEDLREKYVKLPLSFKRAVRASNIFYKKRALFWRRVCELYPELGGQPMRTDGLTVWREAGK